MNGGIGNRGIGTQDQYVGATVDIGDRPMRLHQRPQQGLHLDEGGVPISRFELPSWTADERLARSIRIGVDLS
jgi:hypothetical protein